jgi:hypothetical protein
MRTWRAIDWDGNTHYISAYTESDAYQQAIDLCGGNLKTFEED